MYCNCKGTGIAQLHSAVLRAGWPGVRFPTGSGNFSFHHRAQTHSGAYTASCPICNRNSFLGVKRLGREAVHSPSSSEVKNAWSYISPPPLRLYGVVLS